MSRKIMSLFRSLSLRSPLPVAITSEAGPSYATRFLATLSVKASQVNTTESTPSTEQARPYPFSASAIVPVKSAPLSIQVGKTAPPEPKSRFRGVMTRVHNDLRTQYDPNKRFTSLFERNSKERIPPGSVLVVELWTTPLKTNYSTFSGVLMAVRRRGVSTSFVLRNLVLKLGVEMRFNLYSPLLKDIRIIQRAMAGKNDKSGKLRRTRRAKLYYLRGDDRRLAGVGNIIKQQRVLEERKLEAEKEQSRRR